MTSSQFNQDIRANLLNISRIIHEAGDNELGHLLDKIIRSPDQIGALHDALSKKLKHRTRKAQELESAFKKRRDWFQTFVSRGGKKLKNKEVEQLARITKGWELSTSQVNALLACSTLWASCPGLFWHGGSPDQNVLRNCFNDLERMCDIDPLRRRILLMTLSNKVQEWILYEEDTAGARAQKRKTSPKRERVFLPAALRSMTNELWPNLSPENQERIKQKIKNHSRAGWKWQQLAHKWLSLSFQDGTVKGFERRSWTCIEVEAINRFTETLPQYRIRSCLEKAFDSILIEYAGASSPRHDQFNDTHGIVHDSNTTTYNQSPNCTPVWERSLSHGISGVPMPGDPLFEDTEAASIISSISRNPTAWKSRQGMPAPDEAGDPPPPRPTEPVTTNGTTRNIPHFSAEAIAEPGGVLQLQQCRPSLVPEAQNSVEWAQSSMEFPEPIPPQQNSVFELANPFVSWQPDSYEELDWGAALRDNTLGDQSGDGNLPGSSSNPFLLCDSINPFASLEFDLLTRQIG